MANFPHLKLVNRLSGTHKPRRGFGDPSERSLANLENKIQHGQNLRNNVNAISDAWNSDIQERRNKGLPDLPNPETIPIYLQIDSNIFNPEFLKGFGIEIISEEEDGYIIGASADGFRSLRDKIDEFVNAGKAKNTSTLWQITEGNTWRRNLILSQELNDRWDQIADDENFLLEIGVACFIKLADEPILKEKETDEDFKRRHDKWLITRNELVEPTINLGETQVKFKQRHYKWRKQQKEPVLKEREADEKFKNRHDKWLIKRRAEDLAVDELIDERTELLKNFVELYNGELILDQFINFPDSFCCRIRINGKGLKDLVINFQYVFEIAEAEDLSVSTSEEAYTEIIEAVITAPDNDAPIVCIIDSGILEGHKLLNPAILSEKSKSYVPGDASVIDAVKGGGHGTKVAGATLYGSNIPKGGDEIKLPFFLSNARILDRENELSNNLYPPVLMEQILDDFSESKIFNLSVTSLRPCRTTHMSQWSATLDKLMFEKNILFIVATGNIRKGIGHITNPGINHHLNNGRNYPDYLFEDASRISNPSQSCFALTVGSVCHADFEDLDKKSFGKFGEPSAFTRIGLGLWNMIKPDVVEFGGDLIVEKAAARNITTHEDTSPELVKSGVGAVGKDDVGTSFAAPKVSHIAGTLQKEFPAEGALMYRALIAQSARHPNETFKNPTLNLIRSLGYGIPNLSRATTNTKDRITFITNGSIAAKQAHVYKISIPKEVKRPGFDYDVLVEVTLSYYANPRRTRKGTRSYLSTWLDWDSAKLGETQDMFKDRIIKEMDADVKPTADAGGGINWKIKNKIDNGVDGVRKQDGTLQKDWAILKSNQLPDEFCIAVVGHKGWETKISSEVPYALTISFEVLNAENEIELYQLVQAVNIEVEVEAAIQVALF